MKIDAQKLRALIKSHGLTNTQLAFEAGITRQSLQAMLRADHPVEVRQRTAKGLAQALRLPDENLLSPDALLGYKEAVAEAYADLTFPGLALPRPQPTSMDEIFVPMRAARAPNRHRARDCGLSNAERQEKPIDVPDEREVAQWLPFFRRLLITGDPGSGKTTVLRHLARTHAKGHVAKNRHANESPLPFLVSLADFAKARERDSDMNLVRFVVSRTLRDAPPEYQAKVETRIELELHKGACLVLFDGLDEVGGDARLLTMLRGFIDRFDANQFVLTSRIVGLDEKAWRALEFQSFQIAPWREDDIRQFAKQWYGVQTAVGKRKNKERNLRAEELTSVIMSRKSLRAIASNPLMLTIVAALHHANAALPRRRVDLYAKIVDVMLETWEASKRDARPGDALHGIVLDAREFRWLFERLALGMQREGGLLRPRWWVNDLVQQFLRDHIGLEGDLVKEQGERVIRYLCERTGLLIERGDGMFGFYHRTFQEYFAARGLLLQAESGDDIIDLARPYLFDPQWEEVIVNVAALLSASRATTLLRLALDDPDPAGRFVRRGQRLALRCLVDGAAVADRNLLDQIFSDGEAIGASRWLGISIGFIRQLNQLTATRYEAQAKQMLDQIDRGTMELQEGDYVTVYLSSHEPPDRPRNAAPGTVCQRRLGNRQVELVWPAWDKRIEDPDSWYDEVFKLVRSSKTDIKRRIVLISLLGHASDSNVQVRRILKQLLVKDRSPEIRAECAEALEDAVSEDAVVAKLLLERLDRDDSDLVRKRCAESLRNVAPHNPEVRTRLEELFKSAPKLVRAGAARGISRLDFTSPDHKALLKRIVSTIESHNEPSCVRHSCVWALAPLLGQENMAAADRAIEKCLDDRDLAVKNAALHVLADAIADERRQWSRPLVEKIETMLMAVTKPCPHLLCDLLSIVAMKETHGGRRMERLLGDALTSFGDQIKMAFVFGSVARTEQVESSDIDLMVVGDIRLKELAASLHTTEQTLGRTVNPVLFSPQKFRDQYRKGNPFLLDVVRKEKIFLKGNRDELTELVADRSPD